MKLHLQIHFEILWCWFCVTSGGGMKKVSPFFQKLSL